MMKLPFEVGVSHYDEPLPEVLDDLEAWRAADRFRFANDLRAFVEVDGGRIVDAGYLGRGHIGSTTVRVGKRSVTFEAVALPDLQSEPRIDGASARFVQTAGGRTGAPMPRRVRRPPFVQVTAPIAWTTLALTIDADGNHTHEVLGASAFPRHWIYDMEGRLAAKSGLVDMKRWMLDAFGAKTPWGEEDSPALVTAVETALERKLSATIMRAGRKPRIRTLDEGELLTEQGQPGEELFLLLDGILRVDVDGTALAEVGPGAVLGERAVLEGGVRSSTLAAVTRCKVAVASADEVDRQALETLREGHRREEDR
ncbi:MAG TPA: cyclic nucleotide-binding domain-containing protein [Egibacteraceae bacterium]|nr:cyclic nucleotide-binding domain-containing protein [Egibacteraceae bacterium]